MRWIHSIKKEVIGKTTRAEQGCVEDRTLWTSFIYRIGRSQSQLNGMQPKEVFEEKNNIDFHIHILYCTLDP